MELVNVLVAGSVFATAVGCSLQLWSATAVRARQLTARQQLELQIEQDRLQLQALWRGLRPLNGAAAAGCVATAGQLLALAATRPAAPALRRELQLSGDGQALLLRWSAAGAAAAWREREVTPAGLGLCGPMPSAVGVLLP